MKKIILWFLPVALLAWGCKGDYITTDDSRSDESSATEESSSTADEGSSATDKDSDDIGSTTFERTITITYSSSGASVSGDDNGIVSVSGNQVTVVNTTSEVINYVLTGTASDGFFKLYSTRKQAITLSGADISNSTGAAINNQSKKRTFVVLEGTNKLADGAAYTATDGEDQKAAFFSEGQLVFSGDGSLAVTAKGKAGITSDDYIRFMGDHSIDVTSSAGHGVRGKDYIRVDGGTISVSVSADMKKGFSSDSLVYIGGGATTIKVTGSAAYDSDDKEYSGTAGIKADQLFIMNGGTLDITNTGTGGKGISGDALGYFNGGTVTVNVSGANYTGSKSLASDYTVGAKGIKFDGDLYFKGSTVNLYCKRHEGVESKGNITIEGGSLYVVSDGDDGINCTKVLTVSGGYAYAQSTGLYARSNGKPGDAFDSNGDMVLSGGVAFGVTSATPDLGFDANTEGGAKLYIKSGATVIAIGGLENGTSSNWSQSVYSGSWSKNTNYALYDTSGSLICAFKTPSSGASGLYLTGPSLSSTACKSGVSVSGGSEYAGGMIITGASVSGGSELSLKAYSGGSSGPGGGMNPGGHR